MPRLGQGIGQQVGWCAWQQVMAAGCMAAGSVCIAVPNSIVHNAASRIVPRMFHDIPPPQPTDSQRDRNALIVSHLDPTPVAKSTSGWVASPACRRGDPNHS
jgi:hypothetical protein